MSERIDNIKEKKSPLFSEKICPTCKIGFRTILKTTGRVLPYCLFCQNIRRQKYRKEHIEKERLQDNIRKKRYYQEKKLIRIQKNVEKKNN